MDCFAYNCVELPDHERISCNQYPKGGILAVGILQCGHEVVDPTETELQQAIDDGFLKIIKNVKAILPDAEAVEGENPLACGADTIVDGQNRTITFKDFNVNDANDIFYSKLNGSTTEAFVFECENDKIRWIRNAVSWVSPPVMSPESNKEKQMYNISGKWSEAVDEYPVRYDAPANIFT